MPLSDEVLPPRLDITLISPELARIVYRREKAPALVVFMIAWLGGWGVTCAWLTSFVLQGARAAGSRILAWIIAAGFWGIEAGVAYWLLKMLFERRIVEAGPDRLNVTVKLVMRVRKESIPVDEIRSFEILPDDIEDGRALDWKLKVCGPQASALLWREDWIHCHGLGQLLSRWYEVPLNVPSELNPAPQADAPPPPC